MNEMYTYVVNALNEVKEMNGNLNWKTEYKESEDYVWVYMHLISPSAFLRLKIYYDDLQTELNRLDETKFTELLRNYFNMRYLKMKLDNNNFLKNFKQSY